MITRKQYPNHHVYETEIGGRAFTVETGKVAELADAECICRYGDTVVLTTVTCNPIPKAGIDYFPLTKSCTSGTISGRNCTKNTEKFSPEKVKVFLYFWANL